MVKILLITVFTFTACTLRSQVDAQKKERINSLFIFNAGYRLPASTGNVIRSGHGPYVEVGINPARFFSDKMIIGLYAGWAWKDNLWATSFKDDFLSDYHKAINSEQNFPSLDSAVIANSHYLFSNKKGRSPTLPGCEMRSFHNYSLYYGIMIKLPVDHTFILKVYTGSTRSHYHGKGDLITQQKDYNILQLRRKMYGTELLLVNPLSLFYKKKHMLQNACISIYYEYCNFSTAALYFDDGAQRTIIEFNKFTARSFLKKYKHEQAFGIKFSYIIL